MDSQGPPAWSGRGAADLGRASFAVGAALALVVWWDIPGALRLTATFVAALIARRIDAPRPFDTAFVTAIGLQAWGNVAGLYAALSVYDEIMHVLLPLATAPLLTLGLARLGALPDLVPMARTAPQGAVGIGVVTASLGGTLATLYELYEYGVVRFFGADLYIAFGDTISDLALNGLGAVAGGLWLALWLARAAGREAGAVVLTRTAPDRPRRDAGQSTSARVPQEGR